MARSRDRAEDASGVAEELEATTALFIAPPEFAPTRPNRAVLKEFLMGVKQFRSRGLEPSAGWDPDECDELPHARELAARDPLPRSVQAEGAYYRLPGPAGHKSRYEDPAIERLADIAGSASTQSDVRVYQRRHVRRREALQESNEALSSGRRVGLAYHAASLASLVTLRQRRWCSRRPGRPSCSRCRLPCRWPAFGQGRRQRRCCSIVRRRWCSRQFHRRLTC